MTESELPEMKLKSDYRMPADKVVDLYQLFDDNGVQIWIDGGWGVDALLEEQTREHADLDIAVDHSHEAKMKELLTKRNFKIVMTNDKTDWNYVLGDGQSLIDVHVFGFDEAGNNSYGTKYPKDSLTGTGKINGQTVRCIDPVWMVQFHTRYELAETDRHDVKALCEKFGIELPKSHQI
jgi:lincosamide nucleotidyltransferase A/C/D/E